jgi:predicted signal transduction protein with EAL and GGDEF domain
MFMQSVETALADAWRRVGFPALVIVFCAGRGARTLQRSAALNIAPRRLRLI